MLAGVELEPAALRALAHVDRGAALVEEYALATAGTEGGAALAAGDDGHCPELLLLRRDRAAVREEPALLDVQLDLARRRVAPLGWAPRSARVCRMKLRAARSLSKSLQSRLEQ